MDNNNNQSTDTQWNSARPPEQPPKQLQKAMVRHFILLVLFIVGLIIFVIIGIGMFREGVAKKNLGKTAVQSLMLKVDNPASVTVLEVSKADSVFQNRYCSERETIELSQKFLDYSLSLMESNSNRTDYGDPLFVSMTERYTRDSDNIDKLNTMLANPKGDFCGYKIKVKYKAIDKNESPYTTEAWFIFDKEKQHIIDYLEIPIL